MEEQTTLSGFIEELKAIHAQRELCRTIDSQLKEENKKLTQMKMDALKRMEAAGLEQQKIPGVGTFSRNKKHSVSVPKDHDSKAQLWDYIQKNYGDEVLADYQTVNSQRLNSFYNAEYERAKERGDIDWQLPGVAEPKVWYDLGIRST